MEIVRYERVLCYAVSVCFILDRLLEQNLVFYMHECGVSTGHL